MDALDKLNIPLLTDSCDIFSVGTIRNADNIIVLKDGSVAEQGTHDELMKQNGSYAAMWNMQLHSTADRTPAIESG